MLLASVLVDDWRRREWWGDWREGPKVRLREASAIIQDDDRERGDAGAFLSPGITWGNRARLPDQPRGRGKVEAATSIRELSNSRVTRVPAPIRLVQGRAPTEPNGSALSSAPYF